MPSIFEIFIMGVIVVGMGIAIMRSGQRNPEGTGKLSREVGDLKIQVRQIEEEIQGMATGKDIETLRAELRGYQQTVEARIEGDRKLNKMTHEGVKRIENFLIEKGLGGR